MKLIESQYDSTCSRCWQPIYIGMTIEYDRDTRTARHPDCKPTPRPEAEGDLKLAVDYLRELEAPGEFDSSLLEQYERKGFLSERQIASVLRKIQERDTPGPDVVPAGKYALPLPEELGGGFFFVKVWRGRDPMYVRCYLLQGGEIDFDDEAETLIDAKDTLAMIIAYGAADSARLYGRRRGHCSQCDQALRNALSRYLDIGPVCGKRFYPEHIWAIEKTKGRMWLRNHGIDPTQDLPLDVDLTALQEAKG